VLVGRRLGVRIWSHRPSEETEARPDQLYGEEECRHPWCELEVSPRSVWSLSAITFVPKRTDKCGPLREMEELGIQRCN